MSGVTLKLMQPAKALADEQAAKIVLPAMKGDLTVLPSRAPLSLLLRNGQIRLLDADNRVIGRYFVQGGVVNAAADVCQVSSPRIENAEDMTPEKARELAVSAPKQEDRDYYQMVVDEFNLFGRVK